MSVRVLTGDCRTRLAELEPESVHCIVTSPPYFGLRDYGVDGQIGLETSPEDYIAELVAVFREARKALRDDGTLWLNLGDSYAGSWGAQSRIGNFPSPKSTLTTNGGRGPKAGDKYSALSASQIAAHPKRTNTGSVPKNAGFKAKDLLGIPWSVAFALRADGWWLRSDIIWHKPNPMPESVTDRPTSAHEHVFLLAKSERYFFDAEAVKEIAAVPADAFVPATGQNKNNSSVTLRNDGGRHGGGQLGSPGFRNIRNVWTIATEPYSEAHFATFPPSLIEPCIKAGTSEKGVCAKCGAPWMRQLGDPEKTGGRGAGNGFKRDHRISVGGRGDETIWEPKSRATVGWSPSCACGAEAVPATVLDPFGGAGTTGLVADRLKRNAILIELNPAYAEMARNRIREDAGMFGEVA